MNNSGCPAIPNEYLSILGEREGFGASVTGAASGCLYVVTNSNDSGPGSLRDGVALGNRWIVFDGDFHIQLKSRLELTRDLTIDGRGRRVTISGNTLRMYGPSDRNVILHNLTLRDVINGAAGDIVSVTDGATHFWFHHLTLANSSDEYVDITDADPSGVYGTISWTRFDPGSTNTNEYVMLVGDGQDWSTNPAIHVTLHHNWYNKTRQRHPLITGAVVHSYNNYIQWRLFGIHVRKLDSHQGASVVSENDVFDATHAPWNKGDAVKVEDSGNAVRVVNPLLLNGATVQTSNSAQAFQPSSFYSYSLDPTSSVIANVTARAGATR